MKNKWFKIIISILSLFIMILACPVLMRDPIFMDSHERKDPGVFFSSYGDTGAYKFDSETILDSLKRGDTNVFALTNESLGTHIYKTPFVWKQNDYLLITNALHQFVWKETVNDWSLHDMSFFGECGDHIGFDVVKISYAKLTGLQEYSVHMIGIYPRAGEGEWGGNVKFSRSLFDKWYYIDLEKLKVALEDALQIAEDNGGEQARLSVNNLCTVDLSLSPYPYPQWNISYSLVPTRIFEININAYTAEYEILNSKE